MRLKEAIKHAKSVANSSKNCAKCRAEHAQLARWLEELQISREIIRELKQTIRNNEILTEPIWNTLAEMGVMA